MNGFAGFIELSSNSKRWKRSSILKTMGDQLLRPGSINLHTYDDGVLGLVFVREISCALAPSERYITAIDGELPPPESSKNFESVLASSSNAFAIVMWDKIKKELLVARDRLGIKSLYFHESKNFVLFGTELASLLSHPLCPRQPDWSALHPGICPEFFENDKVTTYIQGLELFPAGHWGKWTKSGSSRSQYWRLEDFVEKSSHARIRSPSHYIDTYANLIEESVHHHVEKSKAGIFLSGGLDSALVTAIAGKIDKSIPCFTAIEKTTMATGDVQAARQVARHVGVPLHGVLFDGDQLIEDLKFDWARFEYFVSVFKSPRFDLSWVFKHELHRFVMKTYPMLGQILLGQGSDEFSGGYSTHSQNNKNWNDYSSELKISRGLDYKRPNSVVGELENYIFPFDRTPSRVTRLTGFQREILWRRNLIQSVNLWHETSIASRFGKVAAFPFLDYRLVEFLTSIPHKLHSRLFWDKFIVRAAGRRWLPRPLAQRPKVPFISVAEDKSTREIRQRMIHAAFPGFEGEFLASGSSIFSPKVYELYDRAQAADGSATQPMDLLLACMCLGAFINFLNKPNRQWKAILEKATPPTEVREYEKLNWNKIEPTLSKRTTRQKIKWSNQSRPVLTSGSEIACFFPHSMHLYRRGRQVALMSLSEETKWVRDFLLFISEPRYKSMTVRQLSSRFKISGQDLKESLNLLWEQGWITDATL